MRLVRVQKNSDEDTVLVAPVESVFCDGSCRRCFGCKTKTIKVKNSIGAALGQVVLLRTNKYLLLLVRFLYLSPVLLLLLGLSFGGLLGGILGFLVGLGVLLWAATKEINVYTIADAYKKSAEKGDNGLD